MAEISRAAIFGKLSPVSYRALESAATFCKLRGNPHVEIVHWIHQLLEIQDTDLGAILEHFELNPGRLATDITAALDRLPRGSASVLAFSSQVEAAMKEAWLYATLLYGASAVRSGHLLVALIKTRELAPLLRGISHEFERIKPDALTDALPQITASTSEADAAAQDGSTLGTQGPAPGGAGDGVAAPAVMGRQEALARFATDLTAKAREGKLDPVVGRDTEVRQVIDILLRRRQNNPILTGEAGVGKTAIVEGFAQRVAAGDVPPVLRDVSLWTLDLGLLQAGASVKGEFENRLRQVIDEVQSSAKPIILFIDEAHTLVGAGGAAGQNDAANLLKPALARGTLRTIAATTRAEYKRYFEKDPALTRRFQEVKVDEPAEPQALEMLRRMVEPMERHHGVLILDEALESAVKLSRRYIPARQLPDKAVSLLDTACGRVAVSQHAAPAALEGARRQVAALETELEIVRRESEMGVDHGGRDAQLGAEKAAAEARVRELEERWEQERGLVERVLDLRRRLLEPAGEAGASVDAAAPSFAVTAEGDGAATAVLDPPRTAGRNGNGDAPPPIDELRRLQTELSELQGEAPLVLPSVDAQAVAAVVADWTGVPVGRMVRDEIRSVLTLADTLERRVIGQRHALEAIAKRIQTSRAGLDNPSRPIGVFMLVGPSGVGKTETALALAEALYGGEQNAVVINMSEFQESHTVSTLKGSPPGYVGYGEGGVLTEAVRRRPYSVVLLDEVEKAHPDVHELFFQVFDKGRLDDGEGRQIDFKNTIILLTSNVGSDQVMRACHGDARPDPEEVAQVLRPQLLDAFPAALLGRLVVVPYYPIDDAMLQGIIRHQLGRVQKRLAEGRGVELSYDDAVIDLIAARCTETESGARAVDAIITHTILPEISRELLERMAEGRAVERVEVNVKRGELTYGFTDARSSG